MNRFKWIAGVLFLMAGLAFINPSTAMAEEEGESAWQETCNSIGGVAELIMTRRQAGASMSQLMSHTDADFLHEIIIDAYKQPRYSTERMQRRVIAEFQDKWYLGCVMQFRE